MTTTASSGVSRQVLPVPYSSNTVCSMYQKEEEEYVFCCLQYSVTAAVPKETRVEECWSGCRLEWGEVGARAPYP